MGDCQRAAASKAAPQPGISLLDLPAPALLNIWGAIEHEGSNPGRLTQSRLAVRCLCKAARTAWPQVTDAKLQLHSMAHETTAKAVAALLWPHALRPGLPPSKQVQLQQLETHVATADGGFAWPERGPLSLSAFFDLARPAIGTLQTLELHGFAEALWDSDVQALIALAPSLHTLRLTRTDITSEGVDALHLLTALQSLTLTNNNAGLSTTLPPCSALQGLSSLTSLTSLEVCGCRFNQEMNWELLHILPTIGHLTNLQRLTLGLPCDDDSSSLLLYSKGALLALAPLTHLTYLRFPCHEELSVEGDFVALASLTQLRHLSLPKTLVLCPYGLLHLLATLTALQRLELGAIDSDSYDPASNPAGTTLSAVGLQELRLTENVSLHHLLVFLEGPLQGMASLRCKGEVLVSIDTFAEDDVQATRVRRAADSLDRCWQRAEPRQDWRQRPGHARADSSPETDTEPMSASLIAQPPSDQPLPPYGLAQIFALSAIGSKLERLCLTDFLVDSTLADALASALPKLELLKLEQCTFGGIDAGQQSVLVRLMQLLPRLSAIGILGFWAGRTNWGESHVDEHIAALCMAAPRPVQLDATGPGAVTKTELQGFIAVAVQRQGYCNVQSIRLPGLWADSCYASDPQ